MIKTNPKYWDCECETNYIHKKTDTLSCPLCGAIEENQPDSMANEVKKFNNTKAKQKIHDLEYHNNRLDLINNSGISVRNLKKVAKGYFADIVVYIENTTERYNQCFYPAKLFGSN